MQMLKQERRTAAVTLVAKRPLHVVAREPANASGTKRTFAGSCHCRAVRFEADLDPGVPTRKCNCSFCVKTRFWKAFADPGDVRVLAGEAVLRSYRFGNGIVRHQFCSRCGAQPFIRSELGDPASERYAINVSCLDENAAALFAATPVRFEDGRNDDWWSQPPVTQHL